MTVKYDNTMSYKTLADIAEDIHQMYVAMGNGVDNFNRFLAEYPNGNRKNSKKP